jgi:hypothetical protein
MMKDEDEFVVRAEREGTPVDVSELRENPFDRSARPRSMLRALSGSRGLGAAALAVAVLVLGWKLKPAAAPPVAPSATVTSAGTASANGVVRLKAADPRSLRSQIVEELRAAGVQASGYEQLGVEGIDADLPRPVPEAVSKVLQQHGVPVPLDGALRIQIAAE